MTLPLPPWDTFTETDSDTLPTSNAVFPRVVRNGAGEGRHGLGVVCRLAEGVCAA